MPTRYAAIATCTFVLGAICGIVLVFLNSDPNEQLELLHHENRLLRQKIQLLEDQLADNNAMLSDPNPPATGTTTTC